MIFNSMEVWKWPEYQALAKRLGIDGLRNSVAVTIELRVNEAVKINHEFLANVRDNEGKNAH